MIRNPAIARLHSEISSLGDYERFLDKCKNQCGIAEYFGVSGKAVSRLFLSMQVADRVSRLKDVKKNG